MSSSNRDAVSGPTRALQDTYLQSLQARQNYLDVVTGGAATAAEREAAHANLHASTMRWFDALQPYLTEYDELEYFWEEVELWPTGYQTEAGAYCPQCDDGWEFDHEQEVLPGYKCPGCGEGILKREEFVATDDSGDPELEFATGLKTLEHYKGKTETRVERVEMTCRIRRVERTVPVRLKAEKLLSASHQLDKAGDRLDLLADVAKNVPQTEITKDTMEQFRDRIKEVVQAAQDGDERATGMVDE